MWGKNLFIILPGLDVRETTGRVIYEIPKDDVEGRDIELRFNSLIIAPRGEQIQGRYSNIFT